MAYAGFTSLCLVFDFVEFLIQYIRFGYKGDEHSDLAMLGITLLFLGVDFFYLAWAVQAKGKFPDALFQGSVSKALLGFGEKMNQELYAFFNESRLRAQRQTGAALGRQP